MKYLLTLATLATLLPIEVMAQTGRQIARHMNNGSMGQTIWYTFLAIIAIISIVAMLIEKRKENQEAKKANKHKTKQQIEAQKQMDRTMKELMEKYKDIDMPILTINEISGK